MKISRLRVENFRSIKLIEIELGATTVLIGPTWKAAKIGAHKQDVETGR